MINDVEFARILMFRCCLAVLSPSGRMQLHRPQLIMSIFLLDAGSAWMKSQTLSKRAQALSTFQFVPMHMTAYLPELLQDGCYLCLTSCLISNECLVYMHTAKINNFFIGFYRVLFNVGVDI